MRVIISESSDNSFGITTLGEQMCETDQRLPLVFGIKKPFYDHVIENTSWLAASWSVESAEFVKFISIGSKGEVKPIDSVQKKSEMVMTV